MAPTVNHLPAMWGTRTGPLGQEGPLGKGLACPLQYPCLSKPMDGGAWWATARGATKSATGLTGGQKSKVKASAGLLSPDPPSVACRWPPYRRGHTGSVS